MVKDVSQSLTAVSIQDTIIVMETPAIHLRTRHSIFLVERWYMHIDASLASPIASLYKIIQGTMYLLHVFIKSGEATSICRPSPFFVTKII